MLFKNIEDLTAEWEAREALKRHEKVNPKKQSNNGLQYSVNITWRDKFCSAATPGYEDTFKKNKLNEKYLFRSAIGTLDDGGTYHIVNPRKDWKDVESDIFGLFTVLTGEGFAISGQMVNEHRTIDTFKQTNVALVDIDDTTTVSLDTIEDHEFYKQYCSGYYTTPSHKPDDHRFRLVFILDRILTKEADIRAVYNSLITIFGGDANCVDGSRIFFGSRNPTAKKIIPNKVIPTEILDILIKEGTVEEVPFEPSENITFDDDDKTTLLQLLRSQSINDYDAWWKMVSAMISADFGFQDLVYVSAGNPNHASGAYKNKTASNLKTYWSSISQRNNRGMGVSAGHLWNLVGGNPNKKQQDVKEDTDWLKAVAKLNDKEPIIVMEENNIVFDHVPMNDVDSIRDAFAVETLFKSVDAATGGGKSWEMVRRIIELACLIEVKVKDAPDLFDMALEQAPIKKTFQQCIIVVPTLVSIDNILGYFWKQLELQGNIDYDVAREIGIYPVTANTNHIEVEDDYRVIITTSAYTLPKGDSNYYFSFMKHFDSRPHVFIDEADNYIDTGTININLGARYVNKNHAIIPYQNCNSRTGCKNPCNDCHYHGDAYRYGFNEHLLPAMMLRTDKEQNVNYDGVWVDQTRLEGEIIQEETIWDTTHVKFLKEIGLPRRIEINIDGIEDGEDPLECSFEDWVAYSRTVTWRPIVMKEMPIRNDTGEFVDRDYIVNSEFNDDAKDSTRKENFTFPYNACNVPRFVGLNMEPLAYISQNCASLTLLTATMGDAHKQFIKDCGIPMEYYTSKTHEDNMMDKVTLVLIDSDRAVEGDDMANKNYVKRIINGLEHKQKPMLVFDKTKRDASKLYYALVNKVKNKTMIAYNKDNLMTVDNSDTVMKLKESGVKSKVGVIYPRSPIARGQNMGEFKISMLVGDPLPPLGFCSGSSTEELLYNILVNRIGIIMQCLGRIMRREDGEGYAERFVIVDVGGMNLNFDLDGKLDKDGYKVFDKAFFQPLQKMAKCVEVEQLFGVDYKLIVGELNSIIDGKGRINYGKVVKDDLDNGCFNNKKEFSEHYGKAKAAILYKSPEVKRMVDEKFKTNRQMKKVVDFKDRLDRGELYRDVYTSMNISRCTNEIKEIVKGLNK